MESTSSPSLNESDNENENENYVQIESETEDAFNGMEEFQMAEDQADNKSKRYSNGTGERGKMYNLPRENETDSIKTKVFCQHEFYNNRGSALQNISLYIYVMSIHIESLTDGEKNNKAILFKNNFDLFKTYAQYPTAKYYVPQVLGNCPPYPSFNKNGSIKNHKKANDFSKFILTVFCPWEANGSSKYPLTWKGFLDFVAELKQIIRKNDIESDSYAFAILTFSWVENAATGTSINTKNAEIMRKYRKKDSDQWKNFSKEENLNFSFNGNNNNSYTIIIILKL